MLADHRSFHSERIKPLLTSARSHVEQLVVLCGGNWLERSALLQQIATDYGLFYAPIGQSFAKALLGQLPRERPVFVMEMLDNLVSSTEVGISLDRIEILFDPELRTDPLRSVQSLARRRLVLLSWPGEYTPTRLIYAKPDHIEYRTYPVGNMLIYSLENLT